MEIVKLKRKKKEKKDKKEKSGTQKVGRKFAYVYNTDILKSISKVNMNELCNAQDGPTKID